MKSWANRVIYLVLLDRFANGDKASDDQGCGEYDPQNPDAFHGGDLKGLISKLPYIKKMGFDAIWVTPAVRNQWISPSTSCRGYHGYWTENFTEIDPHFGTLNDWKTMVRKAHSLGLKVIQDIVVNHTADYFTVDPTKFNPNKPEIAWKSHFEKGPVKGSSTSPVDPVFSNNKPSNNKSKESIYNFTPNIQDYKNRKQTLSHTLADLDDLNLNSKVVRERLKEIYSYWLEQAPVDGYRIDTVFYTPEKFYDDFVPSIKKKAKSLGVQDFFMFAETWTYDFKYLNSYLQSPRGRRRLDSTIDFPLQEKFVEVFFNGAATNILTQTLQSRRIRSDYWIRFLDNHDIERVFSRAPWDSVQQAFVALMTFPGIPCFYYGTEAGLKELRGDFFDPSLSRGKNKEAVFLKKLISFRKKHSDLWNGRIEVVEDSKTDGVFAFKNVGQKSTTLVIFNTSKEERIFVKGFSNALKNIFSSFKLNKLNTSNVIRLPARGFAVLSLLPKNSDGAARAKTNQAVVRKTKEALKARLPESFKNRLDVHWLVNNQVYYEYVNKDLPLSVFRNGEHKVSLLFTKAGQDVINGVHSTSKSFSFNIRQTLKKLDAVAYSAVTSGGIDELFKVKAPTDASYSGQMSINDAQIYVRGPNVELRLKMDAVTNQWNAPYGFDHCYFTILMELPGFKSSTALPKLNYRRGDFRYTHGFFVNGWEISGFSAETSSETTYGGLRAGGVNIKVHPATNEIVFHFLDPDILGLSSWSGVRIWVSTWDGYLGQFHPLLPAPGPWNFSCDSLKTEGKVSSQVVANVYSQVLLEF